MSYSQFFTDRKLYRQVQTFDLKEEEKKFRAHVSVRPHAMTCSPRSISHSGSIALFRRYINYMCVSIVFAAR